LSELAPEPGGLLSVALSVAFPRLDVIQHPALRCPDFPPALLPAVIRYPNANLEKLVFLCKVFTFFDFFMQSLFVFFLY